MTFEDFQKKFSTVLEEPEAAKEPAKNFSFSPADGVTITAKSQDELQQKVGEFYTKAVAKPANPRPPQPGVKASETKNYSAPNLTSEQWANVVVNQGPAEAIKQALQSLLGVEDPVALIKETAARASEAHQAASYLPIDTFRAMSPDVDLEKYGPQLAQILQTAGMGATVSNLRWAVQEAKNQGIIPEAKAAMVVKETEKTEEAPKAPAILPTSGRDPVETGSASSMTKELDRLLDDPSTDIDQALQFLERQGAYQPGSAGMFDK